MPNNLRTEYADNPLGIDALPPRFSWNVAENQIAYRLVCASSPDLLSAPDLWDSGQIESGERTLIPYAGSWLKSRQRVYWRVHIWNRDGILQESETSWFEMGLLEPDDWKGQFLAVPCNGGGGRGYLSDSFPADVEAELWVQIDLGQREVFDRIVLWAVQCPEVGGAMGEGFGFPVRFRIEGLSAVEFQNPELIYETQTDVLNPGRAPWELRLADPVCYRWVRLTVLQSSAVGGPDPGQEQFFALDEFQIFRDTENIAKGKSAHAPNTNYSQIEIGAYDWHVDCITDNIIHPYEVRREASTGNLLRKVFELTKPVSRARAYMASKGFYELAINGQKIGDSVLDSAWTVYGKRLLYSTWDCGGDLKQGGNVLTLLVGNGWTLSPAVILQIEIEHPDGSMTTWCSEPEWRLLPSPIRENNLFHGETYDAGMENHKVFTPEYDDQSFPFADVMANYRPVLSAQMLPPIRVVETLQPLSLAQPHPGVWVFDLGKNIAGWVRLKVPACDRREVRLRFAETIYDDGSVWTDPAQTLSRQSGQWADFQPRYLLFSDQDEVEHYVRAATKDGMINNMNYRVARAIDRYLTSGSGEATWEPRFVFHGFRFVELVNYPETPDLTTLSGRVVHTDLAESGRFECSNPGLNWAWEAARLTLRDNLPSVPTDCCQRDERQGWCGDLHIACEPMLMSFDAASSYIKWLQDARDCQRPDGAFSDTAPYSLGRAGGDIAWGASSIFVAWYSYLYTGDLRILESHFSSMCRYLEFLEKSFPDLLAGADAHYGDWLAVEKTPKDLVENAFWCQAVQVTSLAAGALGNGGERMRLESLSARIKEKFHRQFFDLKTGQYGNGSQASNALPLRFGIVPEELRSAVFNKLVENIERTGGHIGAGVMGSKSVLEVLCEYGRADLVYAMTTTEEYPGWGYMRKHGATTIWEHWEHLTGKGMNSHNHPAHCHIASWMMKYLAGIRPTPEAPGFRKVSLAPVCPDGLNWAGAHLQTPRGTIRTSWQRAGSSIVFRAELPDGCMGVFQPPPMAGVGWKIDGVIATTNMPVTFTDSFCATFMSAGV